MPSWWGKSSSKEVKKKASKESFIDSLHRKFKNPPEGKVNCRSGSSRRRGGDTISEKGSKSPLSRSPSPSKEVSRCQSFAERSRSHKLPLPDLHRVGISRTDSGIGVTAKSKLERSSKTSSFLPLPRPACIRSRPGPADLDGDLVTGSVSGESLSDSDDPNDSRQRSPRATDFAIGARTVIASTEPRYALTSLFHFLSFIRESFFSLSVVLVESLNKVTCIILSIFYSSQLASDALFF